ncbi:MAG: hypothetical protein HKN62_09600, partial [Phycisphaerales bacterium]|nr:hypothetical protein [Phycisphaerales bacterium]
MPASEPPPAGDRYPWWLVATLVAVHVVLFVVAFPPVGLWPLIVLAPVPLAWAALRAPTTRGLILVVVLVQWIGWLWLQRWLVPVTLVGYPLLALYLAGYAAIFAVLMRRLARHRRTTRWPMALLVPVTWVGLETLRGELIFDGYGWYLLAHPLIELPVLAQSADLFGTYG